MSAKQRQRIWVDKRVQGVLVGRAVLYWFIGMMYLAIGLGSAELMNDSELSILQRSMRFFEAFYLWIPGLIMLLPLVILDLVQVSHRFAGPIYRMRLHLKELPQNTDCEPLRFRDDDYWRDLADPINELQRRVKELETHIRHLESPADESPEPSDSGEAAQEEEARIDQPVPA